MGVKFAVFDRTLREFQSRTRQYRFLFGRRERDSAVLCEQTKTFQLF